MGLRCLGQDKGFNVAGLQYPVAQRFEKRSGCRVQFLGGSQMLEYAGP
jgi:hypothetical protein